MAVWYCRACTTPHAVGSARCPHCGSTDVNTEESGVAKITESGVSHTPGEEPEDWVAPDGESLPKHEKNVDAADEPVTSAKNNGADPKSVAGKKK